MFHDMLNKNSKPSYLAVVGSILYNVDMILLNNSTRFFFMSIDAVKVMVDNSKVSWRSSSVLTT